MAVKLADPYYKNCNKEDFNKVASALTRWDNIYMYCYDDVPKLNIRLRRRTANRCAIHREYQKPWKGITDDIFLLKALIRESFRLNNMDKLVQLLIEVDRNDINSYICPALIKKTMSDVESPYEKGEVYCTKNIEALISRFEGKYIAIWEDDVIDSDTSFSALAQRVYKKLGYVSVYMPFVTSKRQILRFASPKYKRV